MIALICVDDAYGMMFNNRRQSRDANLIDKILQLTKGHRLWVNEYSKELFPTDTKNLNVDDSFLSEATSGEYCFIENCPLNPYEKWIEKIILFKWNRAYPSDVVLDIDLDEWRLSAVEEFVGNSHDKITMEVYLK